MNEKDHKPDERLEKMLRQWGANEASRQVNIPPMPEVLRQRRWRTILIRWGPTAAAAAILLVAIGLFVTGGSDGIFATPMEGNAENLKVELARTKDELVKVKNELTTAKNDYKSELAQSRRNIAESLRDAADVSAAMRKAVSEKTELHLQVSLAEARLKEEKSLSKEALSKLDRARKQQAAGKKQLDELVERNKKTQIRLTAAVSELDRVGKKYRQVLTGSQKARAELAALKVWHKAALGDFQRAYLSAAASVGGVGYAGGRIDLAVRQSASRGARLLERCAEIHPSVQATPMGLLMDHLEVVLTRLDLLDSADPAEAKAFAALIRRGELVKKIDETLAGGGYRSDIRIWLLEAKLVLEGAENV